MRRWQSGQQAQAKTTRRKTTRPKKIWKRSARLCNRRCGPQTVRPQKMGISELDLLRNHIAGCWQPPVAAPGAEELKVDILVQLDRDGSVREASIRMQGAIALTGFQGGS